MSMGNEHLDLFVESPAIGKSIIPKRLHAESLNGRTDLLCKGPVLVGVADEDTVCHARLLTHEGVL